ncbi:MAG: hypothetical protein GTN97_03530 [Nitrosopumilaceae archaeon]|nr:hypothetical protein [Nitrosopumilaceae archaeon]
MSFDEKKELDKIKETQRRLERSIKFNKAGFVLAGGIIGFTICHAIHRTLEALP